MCSCDQHLYTPVCGPDDVTYVTPCHAGCLDFNIGINGKIEVPVSFSEQNQWLVAFVVP